MEIKGKTAIVTGGANGVGFSYAEELLRHNAKAVAIFDLPNSNGNVAVENLQKQFGKDRAVYFPCDVTNFEQFESNFRQVVKLFNGLDILINNAGNLEERPWEHTINLNFSALVGATLLFLNVLGKHKGGKGGTIVNTSSICGLMKLSAAPVYAGTKHAVIGFSRGLAENYEQTGVRILVICPGATDTILFRRVTRSTFLDFINYEKERAIIDALICQPAEHVGRAMVELIEKGENGCVCVSENNEAPYAIKFPEYPTLKVPL